MRPSCNVWQLADVAGTMGGIGDAYFGGLAINRLLRLWSITRLTCLHGDAHGPAQAMDG